MELKDPILTMEEDLKRALARPPKDVQWGMLIDTRKCVGCHACTVGCVSENVLPPSVLYRPVFITNKGTYPRLSTEYVPRPCQQCDKPACVPVCPTKGKATWKAVAPGTKLGKKEWERQTAKDYENGLVMIDYKGCIGCGACVAACPYQARSIDGGDYHAANAPFIPPVEKRPSFEYGAKWDRANGGLPVGKARKCHFCLHRVKDGQLTMCTTTCIARATYFGDLADPASLIAKVAAANKTVMMAGVADATPISGSATFGSAATAPRVLYIK